MRPDVLADSYARLEWVDRLAGEAGEIITAVEYGDEPAQGVENDLEHLAFLLGDIATNAWACLDMAVVQACASRNVAIANASFPIDNRQMLGRIARSKLPSGWKDAIRLLQPEEGVGDTGENFEALWIREVSNANKHRNLTPALRSHHKIIWGRHSLRSSVVPVVDDEPAQPRDPRPEVFLWDVQRFKNGSLAPDDAIPARGFTSFAPDYVRHALATFRYAETDGAKGKAPSASPGVWKLVAQMRHPSRSNRWVWDEEDELPPVAQSAPDGGFRDAGDLHDLA